VALQAAMKRRPRPMGDGWLEGIKAIIQRQQCGPAEGDDDRLFFDRQGRRLRPFGAGREVANRSAAFPFSDRLLIVPVALGEHPQAA
jgi:hypothetical protein